MKKLSLSFIILFYGIVFNVVAQQTRWVTEENGSHSSIGFSVDHLVISEVTGEFEDYSVVVLSDRSDFTDAKINFETKVHSINTKDAKRDEHLRGADFFDEENHKTVAFVGRSLKKIKDNRYELVGDLTIKGVTRSVSLDVKFGGVIKDPWGGTRAGFKITGTIDRNVFGLKYNSILDSGGLAIGEEVRIVCNLELLKQA
ncbi:YceI family protein [Fulvivirgaceae bacterium BMA12]|uniref:YceI family protein n=1 Tax=Agaribacillus aureus TaxID=3051825 RepID=A0ABT8LEE4_9BACT|nr:YceI family protein [Fulvivirgaceae bacterium BMA12]